MPDMQQAAAGNEQQIGRARRMMSSVLTDQSPTGPPPFSCETLQTAGVACLSVQARICKWCGKPMTTLQVATHRYYEASAAELSSLSDWPLLEASSSGMTTLLR